MSFHFVETQCFFDAFVDAGDVVVPPLKDFGTREQIGALRDAAVADAAVCLDAVVRGEVGRAVFSEFGQYGFGAVHAGAIREKIGTWAADLENVG